MRKGYNALELVICHNDSDHADVEFGAHTAPNKEKKRGNESCTI